MTMVPRTTEAMSVARCDMVFYVSSCIYSPVTLMNLNTFTQSLQAVDAERITVRHFFDALMTSMGVDDQLPAEDVLARVRHSRDTCTGLEERLLDIGVDVIQWILEPTPENKHIAYVSMNAWFRGLENPWGTI